MNKNIPKTHLDESWKSSDCILSPNHNTLQQKYLSQNGLIPNLSNNWNQSSADWCKYCYVVYKNKCKNIQDIIHVQTGNKTDNDITDNDYEFSITDLNNLKNTCITINYKLSSTGPKGTSNTYKQNAKGIASEIIGLNECANYRLNHHKHCIINTKNTSLKRGDPNHEFYINQINNVVNECQQVLNNPNLVPVKRRSRQRKQIFKNSPALYRSKRSGKCRMKKMSIKVSKRKFRSNNKSIKKKSSYTKKRKSYK